MKYEMYQFIDGLFQDEFGSDETIVRSSIISHERLRDKARQEFLTEMTPGLEKLVEAAEQTIKTYEDRLRTGTIFHSIRLSDERMDVLVTKTKFDFYTYINPILAAYRLKTPDRANVNDEAVTQEMISLISWKTMTSGPESIQSIIQPKLEVFEKQAIARAEELSSTVSEHKRLFDEQKLLHAQAAEATAKAHLELTAAGHAFEQKALDLEDRGESIDASIRQLGADLDAQVARFGTEAARKLWGEREKQSRLALILSSIAISLLIASPIGLAIWYTPEVLHYLAQIVAASALPTTDPSGQVLPTPTDTQVTIAAIGRLVIVTVPIFLYVWAIRLVVRFNSRSLMLLDDARLRLTMLDTFFHLIEKEGAIKEDRALVLNALFRPAPGHGDNVDPPNFTELVTKAMGSGK